MYAGDGYYRRVSFNRPEPSTGKGLTGLWCCLDTHSLQEELLDGCNSDTVVVALAEGYFAVQGGGDWCVDETTVSAHHVVSRWFMRDYPLSLFLTGNAAGIRVYELHNGLSQPHCLS